MSKTINGSTTQYILDGMNVVYEYDSQNAKSYFIGNGLEGYLSGTQRRYYNTEPNGTIYALYGDESANYQTLGEYTYGGYGDILTGIQIDNPFKFAGEYNDDETGLIYLRNRYYDSSIGRFISEDTHWNPDNMIYGDTQKTVKYAIVNDKKIYFDQYGKVIKKEVHNQDISLLSNVLVNDYVQENIQIYNIQRIPDNNSIMQSINLYAYCINNPINNQDKTGEFATVIITAPKWVPWVIAGATAVVTAITGYYASNNQKGLEKGMSANQKEKFQREIEDFKRGMGRGPGDHLPWEILVEIAEEIRKNYK